MFTTDRALVVQTWDAWMADATGVPESAACGEPLVRLYPELASRGLLARLRRVAEGSGVDVLAPALHKYLIPCAPRDRTSRFERMRQHITVAPLRDRDESVDGIVVTIEDVTDRFDRERRLTADLDSEDDAVRLRAATDLAANREAPLLLSEALSDESWRVRRVAAEGMAAGGGRNVLETLIEALREHHRNPPLLNAAVTALANMRDGVAPALIPLLAHDDADVRTYAALALGLVDDARSVPALVASLGDVDANVRFHAIEALGRLGDRRATDALVAVAETRDFFLAFPALDALALICDPAATQRLLPLLDEPLLAEATVSCLGAIGVEDVAVPLATSMNRADAPIVAIAVALAAIYERVERTIGEGALVADLAHATIGPDAAQAMIDSLPTAGDEALRGLAIVLSWLPHEGIDHALAELLRREGIRGLAGDLVTSRGVSVVPLVEAVAASESDPEVRGVAAFALGRIGLASSVPALIAIMAERDDPSVTIAAASALGAIGDRRAFEPLLALLDDDESRVRQAAVGALNSIGHPQMEGVVVDSLGDPSPRVRESAARIAGYFGYGSCVRTIVELCDVDDDPLVRRAAVEALGNYDQRASWSKIIDVVRTDRDASVRAAAVRALGQWNADDSVAALVEAFSDANLWVRYYAARTSAAHRQAAHTTLLSALLERAVRDRTPPVRIAAIDALGAIASPSTLDIVLSITTDPDIDVACASLAALGHFEASRTAHALETVLADDAPRRPNAALDALGRQGVAAAASVPAIAALAHRTRDDALGRHAVDVLVDIGDSAAVAALARLGEHPRLAELVTGAVAALRDESLPWLARELASAPDAARAVLVDGIARMKRAAAAGLLASVLEDRSAHVRLAAARGLGRLDLRDARTRLDAVARTDENRAVRAAAQAALSRT